MTAKLFNALFIAVTALAVGMELWASFDSDPDTTPWTDMIVGLSPMEVTFAAIGALTLWLPIHFAIRYRRKHEAEKEIEQ